MAKKLIVSITLLTVLANGLILVPRTEAATSVFEACTGSIGTSILGLLGGGVGGRVLSQFSGTVPVSDTSAQTQIAAGRVQSCVQVLLDQLQQLALATLKRRVLDVMVDETINWIQGGGTPQFVTNFNDFINSAGQAAAGDVIRDIGLGQLCQGIRMPLLQFVAGGRAAGAPPFSQQITCTLDRVVNNLNNFYNNFQAGGWVAFTTSWQPQNNYYGAILLGGDELISKSLARKQAAQASAAAGQGFTPTERCLEWTLWGIKLDSSSVQIKTVDGSQNPDPHIQPDIPQNVSSNDYPRGIYWICSKTTITTPANTLAGVTQKALTAHIDSVINANTFADYAQAMLGALINRVIQKSVAGILGVAAPNAPHAGYVDTSQRGSAPDDLLGGAGTSYTNVVSQTQSAPALTNLSTQLNIAQTTLSQINPTLQNASTTNNNIKTTLANFVSWCNANGGATNHLNSCGPLNGALTAANALNTELTQKFAQVPPLQNQLIDLITQVNLAGAGDLSTLTSSVNSLTGQINGLSDYALTTVGKLTAQQTNLQNNYNACVNPSGGNNLCN